MTELVNVGWSDRFRDNPTHRCGRCHDRCMVQMTSWRVFDGPLKGETFALDQDRGVQFNFTLPDGRVAVYRTGWGESNLMYFMCIDPDA